jgi:hypothetical protein
MSLANPWTPNQAAFIHYHLVCCRFRPTLEVLIAGALGAETSYRCRPVSEPFLPNDRRPSPSARRRGPREERGPSPRRAYAHVVLVCPAIICRSLDASNRFSSQPPSQRCELDKKTSSLSSDSTQRLLISTGQTRSILKKPWNGKLSGFKQSDTP